jgi:hypothetical protein
MAAALIAAAVAIVGAVVAAVADAGEPMESSMMLPITPRKVGLVLRFAVCLTVPLLVVMPTPIAATTTAQTTFKSPQDAIDALVTAIKTDKTDELVSILGPEGQKLASSADQVADEAARMRFATAYDEGHRIEAGRRRACRPHRRQG